MVAYSQDFQHYATQVNLTSARIIVRWLLDQLPVESVADFGCAQGAWLMAWQEQGIVDVMGIDGDYVKPQHLVIDPARFMAHDLTAPLNLQRRFSLVQCLEVAEHLPATAATTLIDNLTRHAPLVLFSAAPPGQGGRHLLFAHKDMLPHLPPTFLQKQCTIDQIPEVSPWLYRMRCQIIKRLPYSVQQQLAVVAEQVHLLISKYR